MNERVKCEGTDGSGVSYEEACKLGVDGVNTTGVAVDVSDQVLNKEACNTEEASTFSEYFFFAASFGTAPHRSVGPWFILGSGSCYNAFWLLLQCHFQEELRLA